MAERPNKRQRSTGYREAGTTSFDGQGDSNITYVPTTFLPYSPLRNNPSFTTTYLSALNTYTTSFAFCHSHTLLFVHIIYHPSLNTSHCISAVLPCAFNFHKCLGRVHEPSPNFLQHWEGVPASLSSSASILAHVPLHFFVQNQISFLLQSLKNTSQHSLHHVRATHSSLSQYSDISSQSTYTASIHASTTWCLWLKRQSNSR